MPDPRYAIFYTMLAELLFISTSSNTNISYVMYGHLYLSHRRSPENVQYTIVRTLVISPTVNIDKSHTLTALKHLENSHCQHEISQILRLNMRCDPLKLFNTVTPTYEQVR